jgi:hypothetical protein
VDPEARPSAALPVAAALGGFAVLATVAAVPGSPFQPAQPPGSPASGPFTSLALAIGLDHVQGDLLVGIGMLGAVAALLGFGWLVRAAWRGQLTLRSGVLLAIVLHAAALTLPLLFSRDVYSYIYYGRIGGVYGQNPYLATPLDFAGDPLWRLVGPLWVDTPAVYGPLFTTLASTLARWVPSIGTQVEVYRWVAAAASLGTVGVIAFASRRLWPSRAAFAVVAFGANPVVLFHSVASGHNDLLVALAIAGGFALLVWRRRLLAVAVLTLGALIKAPAVLPLLLLIVWTVARRPPGRRLRALLPRVVLAGGVALVFAFPYLQTDDPTLGVVELAGHEGWLAPSIWLRRWIDRLSFFSLGTAVRVAIAALLVAGVVLLCRHVARRADLMRTVELGAAWGWSLLLLTVLGPVLLPWYVTWSLPLAWMLPGRARRAVLGTGGLLVLAQWTVDPFRFPTAFRVNLWVNEWLVTPAAIVLTVLALTDLWRRLRDARPLEEE